MIWHHMTQARLDEADDVGHQRHIIAVRGGWVHRNHRPRNDAADLLNDQRSARCELAAHLALGTVFWNKLHGHAYGQKQPDLDGFIDVKERRQFNHNLIVQHDDPAAWAYLSVCSENSPDFAIDTWCWGEEAQALNPDGSKRYWRELVPGRPAHVIDPRETIMKDPLELLAIIRLNQPKKAEP